MTAYESYLRQFAVLRQARGLPPAPPPHRPRRHSFLTFEYEIDLKFNALPSVSTSDLVHNVALQRNNKPDLVCPLCDRISAFTSIIAIWSHIVRQHETRGQDVLLEAIRNMGVLWSNYYEGRTHRGKNDPTMQKLEQVKRPDFSWETILSWGLH